MSGGPYGRGKAPERACMPIDQWPKADRRLWLAACATGDILDEEVGARSAHARISNTWTMADLPRAVGTGNPD